MISKSWTRALFFALVSFFSSLSAQTNDTLGWSSFNDGFFHTFYNGLGFPSGSNVYGDRAKAQQFNVNDGWFVFTGALVRFARVVDADSSDTSFVTLKICAMNASGTGSNGLLISAPGTVWQEVNMPLSSLDTGTWMSIPFSSFACAESFAVVMDMNGLKQGDSISLYHSNPNNVLPDDLSWEQRADGTWKTLRYSWPLDVDLSIVAMVERSTGMDERSEEKGIQFTRRYNLIEWQYATDHPVNLSVYDLQGRLLMNSEVNAGMGSLILKSDLASIPLLLRGKGFSVLLFP
jgi:hypothetical protein